MWYKINELRIKKINFAKNACRWVKKSWGEWIIKNKNKIIIRNKKIQKRVFEHRKRGGVGF